MLLLEILNLEQMAQWIWGTGTLNLVTLAGSGGSSQSPEHLWQEGGGQWWCPMCRIPRSSGAGSWVHCLAVATVVSSSDTSLASLGNAHFLCLIFLSSWWFCELLLTYQCIWYLLKSSRVNVYCLQLKILTHTTGPGCSPKTSIFNSLSKWF